MKDFNDDLHVYFDSDTQEWVAEFTTYIDNKEVPRAVRCKTQERLMQRVAQIRSYVNR
jgi:hypothetical protein